MSELKSVKFGPFKGYQSSVEAMSAPPEFIVGATDGYGASGIPGSRDVMLDPLSGMWFRRKGCAIVGDTLSSGVEVNGLLEAGMKFSAKPRKLFALSSPSLASKKSTYAVLYGNDTNAATFPTADTGWFGTLYLRNSYTTTDPQTPSGENYNLLADFSSTHYPTNTGGFIPANVGLIVCPPLWYESAEGGYHRGAFRFSRQFMTSGSRNAVVSGSGVSFPCLRSTPITWDATFNNVSGSATTNHVRVSPTGPLPPLPTATIATGTATSGNDAAWSDGDTFYYSVLFRMKDGSFSAPCLPRPINANLSAGLMLKVVGTIGGVATYRNVTWSNIPVGPDGTQERVLLRSPKQARSLSTDPITIDPFDLRPIAVLTNNTQTSYVDTSGSDGGLTENDQVVRLDTVVPRRGRYLWTGDQRVMTGYTLPSPHGIMLAPTGFTNTGDMSDETDDSANVQGTSSVFTYRITTTGIDLYYATASTSLAAAKTFTWASAPTIQDVVDKINATVVGDSCKEWRAQVVPGVDPSADSANLLPSTWSIANCSTSGSSTILTTSGSFANVPIGYYITGTGVTTGTYVVSKASNTSLTMSAAMTVPAATTLDFSAYTGDGTGAANYWGGTGPVVGLMRAFCGAYPGFVYQKRSKLQGYSRPDTQKVFFTVGSPGAAAAGSSTSIHAWGADNFRLPSISNPGILLGGVDIEGGALVAYSGGITLFKNVRGANTGEDFDYKLFTVNPGRGPIAWSALVSGNGWAAYVTREGIFATDKNQNEISIGGALINNSRGIGDLAYEIAASLSSTDADGDSAGIHLAVLGHRIAMSYSSTASIRNIIFYDFSPGMDASGVAELADPGTRQPYGWSAPCTYNAVNSTHLSVCGAVPSNAGMAYYACHDGNNSGANKGDGRVDQIETGSADNAEAQFHGIAYMPQYMPEDFSRMSPQRIEVTHRMPNGSTTVIKVSRDQTFAASNSYLLTSSGSNQYTNEIIQLKSNPDRAPADVVWMAWDDSTATQGNGLWSVSLQYQSLPS